jgi:glycosyltransferase involved in cell wall biosynthesis
VADNAGDLVRIGIDARFLTHPQAGGFKTYTENLIAALDECDDKNEYILYLDREPDQRSRLPTGSNFEIRIVQERVPLIGMLWREQLDLSRRVWRDRLDLFHSPCMTAPLRLPCPLVVTIHDMIWYSQKYTLGKPKHMKQELIHWYWRKVAERAAHRAAVVLTVSEASKRSIVQELGLADNRIFVTYEAASEIYRPITEGQLTAQLRQRYALDCEFILAIGSADPRKNIATLIDAYAILPATLQEQYQLVIVWTHPSLAPETQELVERLGLSERLQFVKQVPNEDLVVLYNAATLFVFPSQNEGFGLPLLEAMSCGTPVLTTDNSSIPEVVGDAAIMVEADDTDAMAKEMGRLLMDPSLREELVERGFKRAAGFSWSNCGRDTLRVYEEVYEKCSAQLSYQL